MIKKIRLKFIFISNMAILVVLSLLIGLINIMNYNSIKKAADQTLIDISIHADDKRPDEEKESEFNNGFFLETPYATRYFSLTLNLETNALTINRDKIESIDNNTAIEYMVAVSQKKKNSGFIETYRYLILSSKTEVSYYFLNCEKDISNFYSFLYYSILFGFLGLILFSLLIYFFSSFAIKPTIESYSKQKSFITNAGHEFKTPLSIISANTEILEMEIGENEWLTSISHQVTRLNQLTKNLILLSRMGESNLNIEFQNFNLSVAFEETIRLFNPLLENKKFNINSQIQENIDFNGNEELIRQMLSLLIDNSIKYSSGNEINFELKMDNKNIIITISNETNDITIGNHNILFERFYRLDKSRNTESGGSGIGLSIVKEIVETHKGKIEAFSSDGKTLKFKITL